MPRVLLLPLGPVTALTFTACALVALASPAATTPTVSSPLRQPRPVPLPIHTPLRSAGSRLRSDRPFGRSSPAVPHGQRADGGATGAVGAEQAPPLHLTSCPSWPRSCTITGR